MPDPVDQIATFEIDDTDKRKNYKDDGSVFACMYSQDEERNRDQGNWSENDKRKFISTPNVPPKPILVVGTIGI